MLFTCTGINELESLFTPDSISILFASSEFLSFASLGQTEKSQNLIGLARKACQFFLPLLLLASPPLTPILT